MSPVSINQDERVQFYASFNQAQVALTNLNKAATPQERQAAEKTFVQSYEQIKDRPLPSPSSRDEKTLGDMENKYKQLMDMRQQQIMGAVGEIAPKREEILKAQEEIKQKQTVLMTQVTGTATVSVENLRKASYEFADSWKEIKTKYALTEEMIAGNVQLKSIDVAAQKIDDIRNSDMDQKEKDKVLAGSGVEIIDRITLGRVMKDSLFGKALSPAEATPAPKTPEVEGQALKPFSREVKVDIDASGWIINDKGEKVRGNADPIPYSCTVNLPDGIQKTYGAKNTDDLIDQVKKDLKATYKDSSVTVKEVGYMEGNEQGKAVGSYLQLSVAPKS